MAKPTRREMLAACAGPALGSAAGARPNVILVITDDQGNGDLSCHGNPYLNTPNIDSLAKEGIEFPRFYVSPVCAPTRSSLLTGRYNLRCGVYGVTRGFETMWPDETTLAEALRGAGYRTGIFGKWHLGEHYPYVPHAQGFEEFIGIRLGNWLNYFDAEVEKNGKPYQTKGYIADAFTNEALRFVEENKSRPFFLYLPYNTPHSPYQAPDEYLARFRNKPELTMETAAVYAMVENLDANIGRLLAKLEELKLKENTIVIFLTDNGPSGKRYNSGLRAAKASLYEGGVRVPFFIRWPARLRGGRKIDTIAAHIDVYPTVLDLCGVARPKGKPIDGLSLKPLLEGKAESWPDRMIFLTQTPPRDPEAATRGAVRTQRFNLIHGEELYEIPVDPGEQTNVAAKYPEVAGRLKDAYATWYAAVARECQFTRKPIPVGYAEENPVTLPAPQSYFDGELRYDGGPGYAHDWLTGWTRLEDKVWWDIDVVAEGTYEIALRYACPAADAGARVEVSAGAAKLEARISRATEMTPVPNRNLVAGGHYIELPWERLELGRMKLAKGRTKLTVRALSKPGAAVVELKSAVVKKI